MHAATEAIGMMASLTSFLLWLPQGARVWKHRHDPARLAGIAVSTQVIALAGNLLWGVYALLIDSFWLGAPAVVNGPIAIGTILVLRRGAPAAATPAATPALPDAPAAPTQPEADRPARTLQAPGTAVALDDVEPVGRGTRELVLV
ncbi:hypothetical protein [Cellulomonas aerilata]|uniref:MtN3 and saliva related transmembrane protein n=1 Tax=Cellulomonas aerilata TaxID=515326 RepID=A0A512D760_9CELL|nr:hypothetical protein [Cellulomonas aerilata]GEO32306.1 hypothetical protein CAE01nite_00310 [Cellulomonas aerilata]